VASIVAPEVGEVVVFGSEGFARVESIDEQEVLGRATTLLKLFVFDSSMTVSVPLQRARERGLRPVATPDEAEAVLDALATGRWTSIPWNRDGRLVKERYAVGDLESVVDVIGSIVEVAATKRLNDAQRTLHERARRSLAREIATALDLEQSAAESRIDEAVEPRLEA
jgi:CarD family transcriptional regulator